MASTPQEAQKPLSPWDSGPIIGLTVAAVILASASAGAIILYYQKREEERRQAEEARWKSFLFTYLPLVIFATCLLAVMLYVKDPSLFGEPKLGKVLPPLFRAAGDAEAKAEEGAEKVKDKFAALGGALFSRRTKFLLGFCAGIATVLYLRHRYYQQEGQQAAQQG